MTFIGPPHFGQRQRSLEFLLPEMSCSVCGAEPSMKAKRQELGVSPVDEEAEVPDAHETFGKHVQQEAAGIHREKESATSVRCCERSRANE